MAARIVGHPDWRFFDDSGNVLANGTIDFHDPGTSTDKSIYKDAAKATEHTNPVVLDAAGRPPSPVFGEGQYDVTIKNSSGTTITTISNWGDNFSTNSEQSPNLVCNGSFEDDDDSDNVPDNWTFDNGSSGARIITDRSDGLACVKFTATSSSSDSILGCFMPISANSAYEISFEYKTSNSACLPKVEIQEYDSAQSTNGTYTLFAPTTSATAWTKVQHLRYVPDSGDYWAKIRFYANTAGSAYDTYIDNVQIKEVPVIPEPGFQPNGLILSRDSGDTSHDINITAGSVIASDGVYPLVLETEITKQADATWALGDDAGGRAASTSLPAEGLLYVWLIGDSDTGRVDVLIDDSATSPEMPSGWDKSRLIGCWMFDSSNNLAAGYHRGLQFEWFIDVEDVTDSTLTDGTFETGTLSSPPNSIALINASCVIAGTADEDVFLLIRPTGADWDNTQDGAFIGVEGDTGNNMEAIISQGQVYVDASSQMQYTFSIGAGTSTSETITILTRGCIMLTRDNP